jgi:hypothetical protein
MYVLAYYYGIHPPILFLILVLFSQDHIQTLT